VSCAFSVCCGAPAARLERAHERAADPVAPPRFPHRHALRLRRAVGERAEACGADGLAVEEGEEVRGAGVVRVHLLVSGTRCSSTKTSRRIRETLRELVWPATRISSTALIVCSRCVETEERLSPGVHADLPRDAVRRLARGSNAAGVDPAEVMPRAERDPVVAPLSPPRERKTMW
jgi:hypothetical protein